MYVENLKMIIIETAVYENNLDRDKTMIGDKITDLLQLKVKNKFLLQKKL